MSCTNATRLQAACPTVIPLMDSVDISGSDRFLPGSTGGYIKGRFTQKDLDQRSVRYVIDPDIEVTADSFEFHVADPAGNIMLPEAYVQPP